MLAWYINKDANTVYSINIVVLKTWIVEQLINFFRNFVSSKDNLNFVGQDSHDVASARFTKLKFKTIIFIKQITSSIASNQLPPPLVTLLYDIAKYGNFAPVDYLTPYERRCISIDDYGALYNVTDDTK